MTKPRLLLICNAHLDPVWQWRWEEGCAEAISTFRTAVEILNEDKDLIFNHNESVLYQWVKEYDPDLFEEIKKLVEAGRWFISGGWFIQPDANIPGVESFIRHMKEGRRFFKEEFGIETPKAAYNFDSFGHNGGLPQLLTQAGYKMYIHMRPHQAELPIPSDLYTWEGIDGSRILVYRVTVGLYHTEYDNMTQRLEEGTELALKLNRDVPVFWGIGDHGGGATRSDLEKIREFMAHENRVEVVHCTTDGIYEALKQYADAAPVVKGDIQRIWTGCYTSLSRVKRESSANLSRLVQTEALRTATWWTMGQKYPEDTFREIWCDHLFNDFHDILPGTCIEGGEQDALAQYGKSAETARRLRIGDAALYARQEPYESAYLPVVVVNSNPALKAAPIELECQSCLRPFWTGEWHLHLYKPDGTEIPCQEEQPDALLPFHDWRRRISFFADDLPALGAVSYRLIPKEEAKLKVEHIPALDYHYNMQTGKVDTLNVSGINVLKAPALKFLVIEDTADSWGTDWWKYDNVVGEFALVEGSVQLIEEGPVRKVVESIFEYKQSKIAMKVISYSQFEALEIQLRVHWNEEKRRLKLAIPTKFSSEPYCEVPGGSIARPADGDEWVHSRWLMLEGELEGTATALGIVNNGQFGFDCLDGEVRLSVLRSTPYCSHHQKELLEFPYRKHSDIGVHDIKLLLKPGTPDEVKDQMAALADYVAMPPVAYSHLPVGSYSNKQGTDVPRDLFSVDNPAIRLLACKRSDDGKALIIRLHETIGEHALATLDIHLPEVKKGLVFKPFEIKTLRVSRNGNIRETDFLTEE